MGRRKRSTRRSDDTPAPTRALVDLAEDYLPERIRTATDAVELSIGDEDVTLRLPTDKVVRGLMKLGRVAVVLISALAGWLLGTQKPTGAQPGVLPPESCAAPKPVAEDPG
jgi:hypothetical protein